MVMVMVMIMIMIIESILIDDIPPPGLYIPLVPRRSYIDDTSYYCLFIVIIIVIVRGGISRGLSLLLLI